MATVAALDTDTVPDSEAFQAPFGTALRLRLVAGADGPVPVASRVRPALLLSPELALVDPELRALALEGLPARNPDAFLERVPSTMSRTSTGPLAAPVQPAPTVHSTRARRRELTVAVIAYTLQQAIRFAVEATAAVGCLIALVMVIQLIRS
jgi:hypothetical protein